MKVMILAAGYGKRLRPLTDHTPKPLVEIGGKPMIVHHLEKLSAAGFSDAVINLGHLGHKMPEALGDGASWGMNIAYSDEGPDPLETGGGLSQSSSSLGRGYVPSSQWRRLVRYGLRRNPQGTSSQRRCHAVSRAEACMARARRFFPYRRRSSS